MTPGVNPNPDARSDLTVRLSAESRFEGETRPAFLGRLARIASMYPHTELQQFDIQWFLHHIEAWNVSDKYTSDGLRFVQAERDFEERETNPLLPGIEKSPDGRLLRVVSSSKITVLARTALLGSDLEEIFTLEASIKQAKPEKTLYPLKLTPREKDVLKLSALTPINIAKKLRIKDATSVSTSLLNAQRSNEISRRELFVRAFNEKIIDLSPLPDKRPVQLTVSELEVLRDYMFISTDAAAKETGFSKKSISEDRESIREKLGVETDTQAFLVALRDGLLD